LNIVGVEQTRDALDDLNGRIKPVEQPKVGESDFFTEARQQDPRINPASPGFDRHFNSLVETEVNDSINQARQAV
jgi:hypothetical protein